MVDPIRFLRRSVLEGEARAEPHRCEDIEEAMTQVTSAPLTAEAEAILLDILRFDGRLRLTPSSEIPHSMPPEDMLKGLAIETLAEWTGLTHLPEMQRAEALARSPGLSGIARAAIRDAQQARTTRKIVEQEVQKIMVPVAPGETFEVTEKPS